MASTAGSVIATRIAAKPLMTVNHDVNGYLQGVGLVALQHLLPSLVPLFQRLIDAGISPSNIWVLGKPYSTVPGVAASLASANCYVHLPKEGHFSRGEYAEGFHRLANEFWKTVARGIPKSVRKVVVLDEGGWLTRVLPQWNIASSYEIVAIEHTMYGVFGTPAGARSYPTVMMAASSAKTRFESSVIADGIVDRLQNTIKGLSGLDVGIIGIGNLGHAVARSLHTHGISRLSGYDIVASRGARIRFLTRVSHISELVTNCNVILGCTGRDALNPSGALHSVGDQKWLASCSSGNIEFLRVVRELASRNPKFRFDPFRDFRGRIGEREIVLLNGGFPVNFDRAVEYERPSLIQLTRELTFASIMQAALCVDGGCSPEAVMLDPEVQSLLIEEWLVGAEARALFPNWSPHSVEWWQRHSGGTRSAKSLAPFVAIGAS